MIGVTVDCNHLSIFIARGGDRPTCETRPSSDPPEQFPPEAREKQKERKKNGNYCSVVCRRFPTQEFLDLFSGPRLRPFRLLSLARRVLRPVPEGRVDRFSLSPARVRVHSLATPQHVFVSVCVENFPRLML